MCFIERETRNFNPRFREMLPWRDIILRAHRMKSDEKPFFVKFMHFFCEKWYMLWLTGIFLYFWTFLKIFLSTMLSLIVPLSFQIHGGGNHLTPLVNRVTEKGLVRRGLTLLALKNHETLFSESQNLNPLKSRDVKHWFSTIPNNHLLCEQHNFWVFRLEIYSLLVNKSPIMSDCLLNLEMYSLLVNKSPINSDCLLNLEIYSLLVNKSPIMSDCLLNLEIYSLLVNKSPIMSDCLLNLEIHGFDFEILFEIKMGGGIRIWHVCNNYLDIHWAAPYTIPGGVLTLKRGTGMCCP